MRWLGDMIAGMECIQNFRCSDCGTQWLVAKDATDAVVFSKIPPKSQKNYKKDTGLRIELLDHAPVQVK